MVSKTLKKWGPEKWRHESAERAKLLYIYRGFYHSRATCAPRLLPNTAPQTPHPPGPSSYTSCHDTHIGYRTSTRNNKDQPSVNQHEIQRSGFKLTNWCPSPSLTSVFVPKGAHGTTEAPRGGAHQTTLELPGETLI